MNYAVVNNEGKENQEILAIFDNKTWAIDWRNKFSKTSHVVEIAIFKYNILNTVSEGI